MKITVFTKKIQRRTIVLGMALAAIFLLGVGNSEKVFASDTGSSAQVEQEKERVLDGGSIDMGDVKLEVLSYDKVTQKSLAVVKKKKHDANAEICGNGVRLRKKPSKSSTILELMYDGEAVWIDWSKYGRGASLSWYYIQRLKTGTYGWAHYDYVYYWD